MAGVDAGLPDMTAGRGGKAATESALDAIEEVIKEGKVLMKDLAESEAAGLAPGRILRQRRKSRELEAHCMLLLGDSLEKAFKEIDIDGSGTLDFSEMKAAFEKAGRSADESKIKIAMDTLDTDRDGVVSLEEFKAIAWKVSTDE